MRSISRKAAIGPIDAPAFRVKRIKTNTPPPTGPITRLQVQDRNQTTLSQPAQENGSIDTEHVDIMVGEEEPGASSMTKSSPQARPSSMRLSNYPSTVEAESPAEVSAKGRQTNLTTPEIPTVKNVRIDFSSAPSHPAKLAIWVARQIGQFEVGDQSSEDANSDHEDSRHSSLSHPPGAEARRKSDAGVDTAIVVEREKKRDENRKRKQSWRTSHLERNKDNDLRCRVNARAKKLFGPHSSVEKTAWMDSEFNKRREKRENRERIEGDFPSFTFDPNLGTKLFSQSTDLSSAINAAGTLLINVLQGVRSTNNREAAAALKAALQDADANSTPFLEAFRILGASPEVVNAINTTMRDFDVFAYADTESVSVNSAQASVCDGGNAPSSLESDAVMPTSGLRGGIADSYNADFAHQPKANVIKAIEAATSILHDIAGGSSDTYVTPYANPPPSIDQNSSMSNGASLQSVNNAVDSRKSAVEPGLDKSDIDDFLKLAAGGSVSDEEEDAAMSDAPDDMSVSGDHTAMPQPDGDVGATLQRIINELMAERNGSQNGVQVDGRLGLPLGTSSTNLYGSSIAKDQAAQLKSLFAQAGVSINTIMPAEQSRATSQLYAHLSSRANTFPTSGGGINPSHASAYGNTTQMTQRILTRPGASLQALQTAPSASRGNVVGPPVRARNAEELRKIQEYGFPPLPGSRPGQKRKH